MTSVSHLRATILAVLNSPDAQDGNQQFFEELMYNKQNLLSVFDVGARNPQEQRELENGMCNVAQCSLCVDHPAALGRIIIDGRSLAVNKDFARQVVFISEQLEVSERHVAGLLHDLMVSTPNVAGEKAIEATILEFHSRRRQLTDCLRYLLEASVVAQNPDAPQLYKQIDLFLQQHILSRENFARAIFMETQKLGDMITKVRVARQNARSETVVPSQQGAWRTCFCPCLALTVQQEDNLGSTYSPHVMIRCGMSAATLPLYSISSDVWATSRRPKSRPS